MAVPRGNAGGERRPRLIQTKLFFRSKSCLPTASGCQFAEAETSERRRFGAALGQGNLRDRAPRYHPRAVTPSEFASSHARTIGWGQANGVLGLLLQRERRLLCRCYGASGEAWHHPRCSTATDG